jgi:Ca-activated chloride channel family protein
MVAMLCLGVFCGATGSVPAQEDENGRIVIHRTVDLVQLDVAVTDKKGNYLTGLSEGDFSIFEDGIPQKVATFEEANNPRKWTGSGSGAESDGTAAATSGADGSLSASFQSPVTGANVFILFDTSNYMYRGFVFAQDAIADFVRTLDHPHSVAIYSYSRDFSRACLLTPDRNRVLRALRSTVAGDDAALYNALLMTVKDAAQISGRKVVVVFSNGPDNASMVAPEDVRELAQSEGVTIYMISTQEAKLEPVSSAVFRRMSASAGGKAYFAKNWEDQQKAFASIRDELAHLYSFSYYPQPNPNSGWRKITVKLVHERAKSYRIRTRTGYRPRAIQSDGTIPPDVGGRTGYETSRNVMPGAKEGAEPSEQSREKSSHRSSLHE